MSCRIWGIRLVLATLAAGACEAAAGEIKYPACQIFQSVFPSFAHPRLMVVLAVVQWNACTVMGHLFVIHK